MTYSLKLKVSNYYKNKNGDTIAIKDRIVVSEDHSNVFHFHMWHFAPGDTIYIDSAGVWYHEDGTYATYGTPKEHVQSHYSLVSLARGHMGS